MNESQPTSLSKSRRRILSCNTCRRLKSRCEYDSRLNACQRCHKLRIDCSLRTVAQALESPDGVVPTNLGASGEQRYSSLPSYDFGVSNQVSKLASVESSLAQLKHDVDKIWRFLQDTVDQSPSSRDQHSEINVNPVPGSNLPSSREQRLESLDYPPLPRTGNDINKDPGRDIINQRILSEDIAEKLTTEFITRLGNVIQIKSIADFTSAASIRHASPLLYAVCCLHGLRFCKDPDLLNTTVHRHLYEEVREMLGQVVLASPIPFEELYALLIMCIFEAAPRPVFEYIESWLLSGICAQQAVSTIDFGQIMINLRLGKHENKDRRSLSLWNNICLVNLRFAVGTGKPTTIPSELLDQCPAILNHPEATLDDGLVLAEILLFSALCNKQVPPSLDRDGRCHDLTAWEQRWKHLLSSPRAICLRFCREFAYLVMAMRSVDKCRPSTIDQPAVQPSQWHPDGVVSAAAGDLIEDHVDASLLSDSFQAFAHKHAFLMARAFLEMPATLVQELPKFHHICISYCALVLSEFIDKAPVSRHQVFQTLSDVVTHYSQFSEEIPAVMNVAMEKMRLSLRRDMTSKQPGGNQPDHRDPSHAGFHISHAAQTQASGAPGEADKIHANPPVHALELGRDFSMDEFDHEMDVSSFPTVEDFFGNWMMDIGNDFPGDSISG